MSERKLEPSPGWCERAYELLRDVQFYRYSPNEHDALMKRGTELMIQSDKAGVSDNEWRAAALDKMNARFKRYVENELKPDSPPQNFDGYCTGCLTRYVTSDSGGTCPVCGARVRPELKLAESDPHCLDDFRMPSDHEIISLWEKQIAEENQRSRDAGEQHPNIGEEFIQAVELARKYYNKAAQKPVPGRSGVVSGWDVPPSEGTEVDPRLQGIPKPAPLPHEVESIGKPICKHCGKYQYVSIYDGDCDLDKGPCPARTDVPALCREIRRLREELRGQFSTMCDLAKMSNEADDKIRSLRDWQARAAVFVRQHLKVIGGMSWGKEEAKALLSELPAEKVGDE